MQPNEIKSTTLYLKIGDISNQWNNVEISHEETKRN